MHIMNGHHLILGEISDLVSGQVVEDTLDERYRQQVAHRLIHQLGYAKKDIGVRVPLHVSAGERSARLYIDFVIRLADRAAMLIKYGPGSLVTRRRSALAASRLVDPYQIPVVVVTNGVGAEVLDGETGDIIAQGLDGIPAKDELIQQMALRGPALLTGERKAMENRIIYAFEVDDSCPCDDTICRL